MFTTLDVAALADCLSQVPPIELKALSLFRELYQSAGGGAHPAVPSDRVVEATRELIAYTQSCAEAIDRLQHLPPVTLTSVEILEWPL